VREAWPNALVLHGEFRLQEVRNADVLITVRKVNADAAADQFERAARRRWSRRKSWQRTQWNGQNAAVIESYG
jgi:hypothetical protein